MPQDDLIIAGRVFASRLLVGTGKYSSLVRAREIVEASGASIITAAVRRMSFAAQGEPSFFELFDPTRYTYLPNSAGATTADEAVRLLRLAREAGAGDLVKLEVVGDPSLLYPDMEETLRAAHVLVKEGFHVMAYSSDDPVYARKLQDVGCVAVMPLAAPIGSGWGLQNPKMISAIVRALSIPVLVDAGIGTASDATRAMELGCAGVLLNTAIAEAGDPMMMAHAMKHAVCAGRLAYCAGRMEVREYADPSSPTQGMLGGI